MEVLIVLVVLAVLAAIVLPRIVGSSRRSRESAARANLKLLRQAVERFYDDTGAYPKQLADLDDATPPANGLDSQANPAAIDPADWHGPYVDSVPEDPLTGTDYVYTSTSPGVGQVSIGATGSDGNGTPFATY